MTVVNHLHGGVVGVDEEDHLGLTVPSTSSPSTPASTGVDPGEGILARTWGVWVHYLSSTRSFNAPAIGTRYLAIAALLVAKVMRDLLSRGRTVLFLGSSPATPAAAFSCALAGDAPIFGRTISPPASALGPAATRQ